MRELFNNWAGQYYTEPMLGVILFLAFAISLKNNNRHEILRFIPAYIFSLLIVFTLSIASDLSNSAGFYGRLFFGLFNYSDYFFTLIEMIIFSHFYFQLSNIYAVRKTIVAVNVLFLFYFIFMGIR